MLENKKSTQKKVLPASRKLVLNSFQGSSARGVWIAWCSLIAGLILTGLSAYYTKYQIDTESKREFDFVCSDLKTNISARLSAHAQLLRSGSAFFTASDTVTRKEWKTFIEHEKINKNLPGIQGIGYSLIIPKSDLDRHIQYIRKEGFPDYKIKPEISSAGEREIYTSIVYLEPFSGRNLRAFGYDMYSEPVRRTAMIQARDSNTAMLAGKVILVQETEKDVQAGTLMYVPVYKNEMPVNTIAERRAAIKGWVYSPYRMNDLMQGILGRWDLHEDKRIHLQIYDGDSLSAETLLFDSQIGDTLNTKETQNLILPVDFNGKQWTLSFTQLDVHSFVYGPALFVLTGGIVISLLIFVLIKTLINIRFKTEALRESEEKFKLLVTQMKQGLALHEVIYDNAGKVVDYRFIELNESFEKQTGLRREEVLGKTVLEVLPNIEPYWIEKYGEVTLTGKLLNYENYSKDMGKYYEVIAYRPKEHLFAVIINDITERKLREEQLRESLVKYQVLFDSFPLGITISDKDGNIIESNQIAEKLLGLSKGEQLKRKIHGGEWNIIKKDGTPFPNEEFASVKALKENRVVENIEMGIVKGENDIIWINVTAAPVQIENYGVVIAYSDITDRKRTEAALLESEENLRKSNAEKDKYFSIIAHDLRSPFNGFLGLTEVMAEGLQNLTQNEIQEIAVMMKKSALNLYSLLGNLLEWSRMQRGLIPFEPQLFLLLQKITECMALVMVAADKKEIAVSYDIPEDLTVFADGNMLDGIIRNLSSNAVKFTRKGGDVIVSGKSMPDNMVEISVKDTGIGMNKEMTDNLFRLDIDTSRKGTEGESSTGLGLIICKDFIEKHGGKLRVESREGKGSTFYFTIPERKD